MDELSKSLHFLIYQEINKVLDNISIDFNINRQEFDKYIYELADNNISNNENTYIELPIISDDDSIDKSNIIINIDNNNKVEDTNIDINNSNNIKCKQMTRKGKQCEYSSKPNSEYCGRHSK